MATSSFDSLGLTEITANLAEGFTEKMGRDLVQIFEWGDQNDCVRVIVLTADPAASLFCVGADMKEVMRGSTLLGRTEVREEDHRDPGGQVALAIYNNRKVTIAAVNGNSAGSGFTSLQLPFDFRLTWTGAIISLPFLRLGILPESISTYLLSRLIGESRATSILLNGTVQKAESPAMSPLYAMILPTRQDVFPRALALAKDLAMNLSSVSVAYTKGLLHHPGSSPEEHHLLDSRGIKILGASKDGAEGLKAFVQRRQPVFQDLLSKNSPKWYPWSLTSCRGYLGHILMFPEERIVEVTAPDSSCFKDRRPPPPLDEDVD
ncbi:ClpP/crotonase-like domain-containing protein [Lentinula edodes]|uniref:ClpP/crotonase-like domain-containing protein n=1 Tax=Lentinula lateritia TaxID=40482 RepID=A0A9W9AFJ3_9AGAR|nr:ClpP/crotonase-like domain-containing protein [Lentinula edodes]